MLWPKALIIAARYFGVCEAIDQVSARRDAGDVYRPKLRRRIFWWFWIGSSGLTIVLESLGHGRGRNDLLLWFWIVMFLASVLTYPRTVVVTPTGVVSFGLFGARRRFIPWTEVTTVTSDWQEATVSYHFSLAWRLMGTRIVVLNRNGTHIDHTIFLRRQGRFLDDLRRYTPKEAFAPGIYDWHP